MHSDMQTTTMSFRQVLIAVLVGVAFYLGARLGLALSTPPDHIATFWPPNTFVLAALLLTDRRRWWIYFLTMTPGYLAAASQAGFPAQRTIIFYAANCTEILVAAIALKSILRNRLAFDRLRDMVMFLLWAVLIAPVISAFLASTSTFAEPEVDYWLAWRVWFLADALGHLTLTPVIILWISLGLGWVREASFARLTEVMGLILCLFLVGVVSLGAEIGASRNLPPCFIPLCLCSFGRRFVSGLQGSAVLRLSLRSWQSGMPSMVGGHLPLTRRQTMSWHYNSF